MSFSSTLPSSRNTVGLGSTMPRISFIGILRPEARATAGRPYISVFFASLWLMLSFRLCHRRAQHHAMQIHRSHGTIFQAVSRPLIGRARFQQSLQRHAIEARVAHHPFLMFGEIGLDMSRELSRFVAVHAVMP